MNKKQLITIAAAASFAMTAQAAKIVQWGQQGGDTGIVTGNDSSGGTLDVVTYDASNLINPPDNTAGYDANAAGRTNEFSGAYSKAQGNIFANNAAGDYIQLLSNTSSLADPWAFDAMLAWDGGADSSGQSAFLTNDDQLESFHVEFKARDGNTNSTVSFLLETAAGWYISNESSTVNDSTWTVFDENVADLTWTGFSQFEVTDGTTIAGTPDTSDIVSVGFYLEATKTSGLNLDWV